MRSLALTVGLLVGCGAAVVPPPDAGQLPGCDAGGVDAGQQPDAGPDAGEADAGPVISCMPGQTFCALGSLWTCTLSGHDANPRQSLCTCAAEHCDGGHEWPEYSGPLFCCSN